MELLAKALLPLLLPLGGAKKVDDVQYMRSVYETLYSQMTSMPNWQGQ